MSEKLTLERWLAENVSVIAPKVLGAAAPKAPVGIHKIKERQGVAVAELDFDGTKAIVKVFDHRSDEARQACEREAFALIALQDTGLAPKLYGFSENGAAIVTERVDGEPLHKTLTAANLLERSHQIGAWLARYIALQPTRKLDISWFDYMNQYKKVITDDVKEEARAKFGAYPVERFALAKNDLHPSNFILRPDGTLVGIDYERSRFKPVGWDVVSASWVLMRRFEGEGRDQDIVQALVAGWNSVGAEATPPLFEEIALFFARQAKHVEWKRQPFKV